MRFKAFLFSLFLVIFSLTSDTRAVRPASKWATLEGNKIHYYDIGSSKADNALVLEHGWTCNADFWKHNYDAFPGYRVIALDLPGHGRSDKPKLNYSMEHFAKAINAVMKNAGVKRAVLVGHSMGTPVARQFYRLYPDRTLGIVVVDGTLRSVFSKAAMEEFFAPLKTDYKTNAAKFVDGMLTSVKDEPLRASIRESMLATPDYVGISAMDGMIDDKIWTDDKITVPVLAVMAPSPFWPKDLKEKYTEIAPNIDFQIWADVSHFLHMEKPREFNEAVKTFVVGNKLL